MYVYIRALYINYLISLVFVYDIYINIYILMYLHVYIPAYICIDRDYRQSPEGAQRQGADLGPAPIVLFTCLKIS